VESEEYTLQQPAGQKRMEYQYTVVIYGWLEMSEQHRFCEKVYCKHCGFATSIMTAEKAMAGKCPHCKKVGGLMPLGY
tara:strand:+ start:2750 stop:2983 length:234 start_codon:yes stop_codon:yes gene_type:complete